MRILFKIIVFLIDKNLRWEESRTWVEAERWPDGFGWDGHWVRQVYMYKKNEHPIKDGFVNSCCVNRLSTLRFFLNWDKHFQNLRDQCH